jgi:phosphinothricin acetyltransferase
MSELSIRSASADDAHDINVIYNEFVIDSHVSFDTAPWTDDQRVGWLTSLLDDGYPVLVAADGVGVIGAAWSGPWRDKEAYRTSVETTIVLIPGSEGAGLGTTLYGSLLAEIAERSFHRAYALIALPNDASVGLHRKLGFTQIGVLNEVGHKGDEYHSTMLMELRLDSA